MKAAGSAVLFAALALTAGAAEFRFERDVTPAAIGAKIEGIPTPFLKRFRLEGSGDRARWTVLVAEGTLFDLPDERLHQREAAFTPGELRYARVVWDDQSSGRVRLPASVSARLAESAPAAAPARIPLELRELPSEPGKSRFRLTLPGEGLPVLAIHVDAEGGHLLRPARVTEGRLMGGEVRPATLGTATLRREVRGELVAADLRIPIEVPKGEQLELVVDNGDNAAMGATRVWGELAPLPFIYFETDSAEKLIARYGNAALKAPRYDLEAARKRARGIRMPEAQWGDARPREVSQRVALESAAPTIGAKLDRSQFRFSRRIDARAAGLTALQLDAEVLARSRNLVDLRIVDREGRQIPYLLERREEPLVVLLKKLQRIVRDQATSDYALEIPHENLPAPKLVLSTEAAVFERDVQVIRPPRGREGRWQLVAQSRWRHADPESPAPQLVLQLPSSALSSLALRVREGDNTPLAISGAKLLLPSYRLRFFHPGGGDITLLYDARVRAPKYDLSLLAPRLVGAAANDASLAGRSTDLDPERGQQQKIVFWSAIGLTALVMLGIIVKLLRGV